MRIGVFGLACSSGSTNPTTCRAFVHGLTSLLITKPDFGWPDADVMMDDYFDRLIFGLLRR